MKRLNKKNIEDILALTPIQEGILFHYLKNPAGDLYFEQLCLDVSGKIDFNIFKSAWNVVIETNAMLRAVFRWEKVDDPVQVILKEYSLQPGLYDFPDTGRRDYRQWLEEIKAKDRKMGFDLREVPFRVTLCKIAEDDFRMIISSHHILYDGWSIGIIVKELFDAYEKLYKKESPAPVAKTEFKEFVKWIHGQDTDKQEKFWRDYLEGFDTRAELSIKKRDKGEEAKAAGNVRVTPESGLTRGLEGFVKTYKLTAAALFYCAWGLLLQGYNNSDDVVFGTTVSGRSVKLQGIEDIVGLFINTIPLRIRTVPGEEIAAFLRRIDHALQMRDEYELTSPVNIKKYSEIDSSEELFDSLVVVENYPLDRRLKGKTGQLSPGSFSMVESTHYDLTIGIIPGIPPGDDIEINFFYREGVFDRESIQRLSVHFLRILRDIIEHPGKAIRDAEILPEEEKNRLLVHFNDSDAPYPAYPADMTIHRIFEDQAEKRGDGIAVVGADAIAVTFKELNKKCDRLARRLIEKGITPGTIVGIMVERSLEMVVGILGILKAGGAYLPIDPGYPENRINYILKDSNARVVLNEENSCIVSNFGLSTSDLSSSNLAYIIYTSGSTGAPKGVAVEHRSVTNTLSALETMYPLKEQDVYLLKTSYTFDVSVTELFGWFFGKGVLSILEKGGEKDPIRIVRTIERTGVTHINFVPSMFTVFVDMLNHGNTGKLAHLKYIFLAGEALLPDAVVKYRALNAGAVLENIYGPTEAAIYACRYSLSGWEPGNPILIGKPTANVKLFILNAHGRLQPTGVPGELCIAGPGVARGYLNNPELTAKRFYRSYKPYKTYRSYKTGDLARWLPDANIEYLGRMDHQVKVRGFRVETGEIEHRLAGHNTIKEAVVTVRKTGSGEAYLCAYIVPRKPGLTAGGLKEYLSHWLPGYMIPSYFIQLDKMPVKPNGKLDRSRLPVPGTRGDDISYTAPRGEVERLIAGVWQDILGLEEVGIHDNFFDVGGNSLSLIRAASRLKDTFNRDIQVTTLFNHPNISALADFIKKGEKGDRPETAGAGGSGMEIAVIGMAGRFPGARDLRQFRENLMLGKECIHFFTKEEAESAGATPELLRDPGFVRAKGVLTDDDMFDAPFFGYTPAEAELMDPQLRVFHECAWEALEDAGYNTETYGRRIGLYAGATHNLLWQVQTLVADTGNLSRQWEVLQYIDKDYLSVRVSYKLNLKGPSVVVQTACSTSLTAIDTACRGLLSGTCDMALAGGVSITGHDAGGYLYREGMVMSPDGHCRAFDEKAGGTVGGNGVGIVVLKPLEQSLRDGDFVYAVIKGSAVNNDGGDRVGFTAPGVAGQASVIRDALQKAKIDAESISYIEAHGTGTMLGDPVEVEALVQAFNTDKKGFCALGSVKTNIGHLDAAAGVAGFIKTVLALKHREIPPSLHFESPNPGVHFENTPFYVITKPKKWKNDEYPLRAGVSSFGIGGTNCHVVLEEAPPPPVFYHEGHEEHEEKKYRLLLLSARTETALDKMTRNLADYLGNKNPGIHIGDVSYTLQTGRRAFNHRQTVVCTDTREVVKTLSSPGSRKVRRFHFKGDRRPVIFMFPGLGSQYVDMGADLYAAEPVFRAEMDRCFQIAAPFLGYDIKSFIYPPGNRSEINRPEISQPVIFIFEYALAKLLMHWGIAPEYMIGYSFGEYTAACLSGVFSLEDALKIVSIRSRLIGELPGGVMLSVPLESEKIKPLLARQAHKDLSLAIDNGPSCIVAGPTDAVEAFESVMREQKHLCMRVNHSHALHSSVMDPVAKVFEQEISRFSFTAPGIPFISNVTGEPITAEDAADPGYWARHLRSTVQFARGVRRLAVIPGALFVEIGPGRDLCNLVDRYLDKAAGSRAVNLVRPRQKETDDVYYLLTQLGRMWLYGVSIDWERFNHGEKRRRIPLPTYPFEGQQYPKARMADFLKGPGKTVERERERREEEPGVLYERPEVTSEYLPPSTDVERKLVKIWQRFFKVRPVGVDDDFFELGGDSLKAAALISIIHQAFNVRLPLAEVFNRPTIKGFSGYIMGAEEKEYVSVEPTEKLEYYPLSASQKRMYILNRFFEYNIPLVYKIEGSPDWKRFEGALQKLVERHEVLRTSIETINGEPVQRIHKNVEFKIEYLTKGDMPRMVRPFDLSEAPLMRVGIVEPPGNESHRLVVFNIHHTVSDGTSLGILVREFFTFYKGEELPEPAIQYKDFTQWERKFFETGTFKEQEAYWLSLFSGETPALDIPTDFPRPPVRDFKGDVVRFTVSGETLREVKTFRAGADVSLYMVLMTVYNILLSRYTTREDIVVGSIIAGREHPGLENLTGVFINTLPIRNHPAGNKTVETFLQEVKTTTLTAFQNQAYPFGELLEKSGVKKDLTRSPLFDVMLILQNMESPTLKTGGLRFVPHDPGIEGTGQYAHAQHDMTLWVVEREESETLEFNLEYSTALFKKETIQRLAGYFLNILKEVITNTGVTISRVDMMGEEERRRLVEDFNDTAEDFPSHQTVVDLFEEQVGKTPDRIAVNMSDRTHMTYSGLNRRSDGLAGLLEERGVRPGTIVGIMVERSLEMLIGLLGILKAGCAYLPIDTDYPEERKNYMLADSGAGLLVTGRDLSGQIAFEKEIISIDNFNAAERRPLNPLTVRPSNPAYIIYTSGTTGRPKGVMVEHRNLRAYLYAFLREFDVLPTDIMLQQASYSFDTFGEEFYPVLLRGGQLAVPSRDEIVDIHLLKDFIIKYGVTIVDCSPLLLNRLNGLDPESRRKMRVHTFISGGDELKAEYVDLLLKGGTVYNTYGPTETTICAAYYRCPTGMNADVPLGKPIANYRVYILDAYDELLPIGAAGQLCIAGPGVARGYLNRPELTAERFYRSYKSYRSYKTGDLARWLPDPAARGTCNIQFLGRIDHQVKIRGYRIELGEIEAHLLAVNEIDQAIVIPKTNKTGDKYLCAYFTGNSTVDTTELNHLLRTKLPSYMVPADIVQLERFPLTPSGKTDIHALPEPGSPAAEDHVPPSNETERQLIRLWSETLGVDETLIGIDAGFFDLGGHSISAMRLLSRVRETFNVEIPLADFFQDGTPRGIARLISGDLPGTPEFLRTPSEINGLIQPFELEKAPLLRASVIKLDHRSHFFFFDMHHIVSDGISIEIITREFSELYQGRQPEAPPIQYKDFSLWQEEFFKSEPFRQQEKYWLERFKEKPPRLELPLDFPRPDLRQGEGKALHLDAGRELTARLKQYAEERDVTLFMLLLAAYSIFLSRLTRSDDIVVGTPVSGRTHENAESIVGMFVNTLALRSFPRPGLTVEAFLAEVKSETLSALENQDYPFEMLVEKLGLSGETSRAPLIDTMFTLQTLAVEAPVFNSEESTVVPYSIPFIGALFDLVLSAVETEEGIRFTFSYDIRLFKEETLQNMGRHFLDLLNWVLDFPRRSIGEPDMTGVPEVRQLEKPALDIPYDLVGIEPDTRELRKGFGFE